MKTLHRLERKNPNYALVRFPINDLEDMLEEWFDEKRDYTKEAITMIQTIVDRETGKEKKIENTIPHKYYSILQHAIRRIKNCRLEKNILNTISKNETMNDDDDSDIEKNQNNNNEINEIDISNNGL